MSCSDANYKGDSAEAIFMSECILRGYSVGIPFGHNNAYDLIVEGYSGKLYKVQVKMSVTNKFHTLVQYKGKVDVFAFLCNHTWVIMDAASLSAKEYKLQTFRINLSKKFDCIENFNIFV